MTIFVQPLIAELSTITAFVGNGIVLAALVGGIAIAWKQGLFPATVVALGCLAAFVAALGSVDSMSSYLVEAEVPAGLAPAASYAIVLTGLLLAVRGACGSWLPEQAVWMGGLASRLVACGIGGIAGSIVAASALIGWTMLPLPSAFVLRPDELFWDPGPWALKIFTRCVEADRERRELVLGSLGTKNASALSASELFFDANTNCVHDPDERYIDLNGDGQFTLVMAVSNTEEEQPSRSPGLLDHYRLAAWRHVMAVHRPRITSETSLTLDAAALGQELYQATFMDLDACDSHTFSLVYPDSERQPDSEPQAKAPSLTIDPLTGVVTLSDSEAASRKATYAFTITVTDKSDLSDTKQVRVTIRGLPDQTPVP
jgi:hypothetical protein